MRRIGRRKRRNKHRIRRRGVVISVANSLGDHHSASFRRLNSSGQELHITTATKHENNQITLGMRVRILMAANYHEGFLDARLLTEILFGKLQFFRGYLLAQLVRDVVQRYRLATGNREEPRARLSRSHSWCKPMGLSRECAFLFVSDLFLEPCLYHLDLLRREIARDRHAVWGFKR